jgi:hypothetical protein
MQQRLFTLAEATLLLPVVRQLLIEIQMQKEEVDACSATLERLLAVTGGNGHLAEDLTKARTEMHEAGSRLEALMGELAETGAELKGIEEGLIDFPSLREGRVVYLCWRLGEDEIAWWHELDTGFAGRQPL